MESLSLELEHTLQANDILDDGMIKHNDLFGNGKRDDVSLIQHD